MIQLLKNTMSYISPNLYEGNRPITFHVFAMLNYFEEKSTSMNGA